MQPNFTANKFKSTVQQRGIGKPLAELKSSFKTKNQLIGFSSEQAVIYLLRKNHWHLEFQRFKTHLAEVDLIFSKNKKVLLIEVKKLNDDWRAFERVGRDQVQRLQKNLIYFSAVMPEFSFESYICWVDRNNQISFVHLS